MERNTNYHEMLENLLFPAFLVNDGVVNCANQAAIARQINIDEPIKPLICVGQPEYEVFKSGRLCLSLSINSVVYLASVVKFENMDLFCLDSDYADAELRAFALASQCLREPLSNALTSIESIQQYDAEANPELEEKIQNIKRSLHQFHRALRNMSDVSQYDRPRTIRTENRNIVAVIGEIMDKAKSVTFPDGHTLEYHSTLKSVLSNVDREKLERAILNLISNAIKYAPANSNIKATLYQVNNKLYFSVENQLCHYTNALKSNLFVRYLREPLPDTQNAGIGLGLTIVRKAAMAHGGTLLFDQPDSDHIRFTMSIAVKTSADRVHSPVTLPIDFTGGFDQLLVELADVLPADLFE